MGGFGCGLWLTSGAAAAAGVAGAAGAAAAAGVYRGPLLLTTLQRFLNNIETAG